MWNHAIVDTGPSGLALYAAAYAAMLVVPGPSFMIVSQASLSASRREAALVAAGVACGAGLLTLLVLRSVATLPSLPGFDEAGRLAGVLVLLLIGARTLRRALRPPMERGGASARALRGGYFAMGLLTALTNPISFSFFSSVALASRTGGDLDGTLMSAGVFAMALVWFGCLAMLLSHPAMQSLYGRAARRLDAVTGAILIAIAFSWLVRGG